jgi:hypothetical protein
MASRGELPALLQTKPFSAAPPLLQTKPYTDHACNKANAHCQRKRKMGRGNIQRTLLSGGEGCIRLNSKLEPRTAKKATNAVEEIG